MIFPYTNFTTNFQGVNIISFDLTSDLDVKLAILNVKIPDTVYWYSVPKSGHVFYGMCLEIGTLDLII